MKTKTFLIIIGVAFLFGCQNTLETSDLNERSPELQMLDTPDTPNLLDKCTNCECGKFKDQCCDACRSPYPERWLHCKCKVKEGESPGDGPEGPGDNPVPLHLPEYKSFNIDVFVGADKKLTYSPVSIAGQPELLYRCNKVWQETGESSGFFEDESLLDNNSYREVFERLGVYPIDYDNNVTYVVDDKGYIYVHVPPNSPILTSNNTSFTTDWIKFYYKSSVGVEDHYGSTYYMFYPRYEISLRVTVIKR